MKAKDNEVKTKPLDRSHQARIQLFKEELNAIIGTMQKQEAVVSSIKACHGKAARTERTRGHDAYEVKYVEIPQDNPYPAGSGADEALFDEFFKQARPSAAHPGGYRNFLAGDCFSSIGSRRVRAEEMRSEGSDLAQWVSPPFFHI